MTKPEWEKHGKWVWIEIPKERYGIPWDLWWLPLVRYTANPFYMTVLWQVRTHG